MRSHKKQYFAIAALAFLFAAACGKNTYADATTINVSTPAQWYSALQTIHGSSNSEFIINLDADVIIDDASVVNNQAIDNGNTVTILGNNHKLKFAIGGDNKIRVNNATLNLGKEGDADGTLSIEGGGSEVTAEKSLLKIDSSTVNIYEGTSISNNYSRSYHLVGSALYVGDNSTINMTGGNIHHNVITSTEICSAIFLEGSNSTFNMTGGELTDNGSDVGDSWGGAIFTYPQNTIIIKNATVSRNKAGAYGGALAIYGSTLTVENSTFEDNETTTTYADDDSRLGGAILNYATVATITSSTFTGNKAALGGAIANESGIVTVSDSIFTNNTSGDKGGAIYSTGDYRVTSSNNSFSGNTSNNKGGAIYSQAKQLNSTNDVITGNTALIGGGVYLDKNENVTSAGSANLSTTKIYNNKATTNANDVFISANAESVQIIDISTVDETAKYGSDTVKTDDWYTDNAGNRYSTSNVTDVVAYDSLAASTEYSLTAAGEKIDGPAPAPDPTPDPETIPDNPPTVDEFGTYVTIISICSLGLAVAIKARK